MTTDNIPQEQASTTESVSQETQTQEKEQPKEQQPLTEERLQQILAQREAQLDARFQSTKDKAVAEARKEAERDARLAKSQTKAYQSVLEGADDDLKPLAEAAKQKGETQFLQDYYNEQERERQAGRYREQLEQSLKDEVVSLGLDPEDKAIDYAQDAPDYFTGRKRFTDSISKALKNKDAEKDKQLEERLNQFEIDFRKKHNLDSQDTTQGAGVVEQSDADFMAAFGAGELPVTKDNLAKLEEIKKRTYK